MITKGTLCRHCSLTAKGFSSNTGSLLFCRHRASKPRSTGLRATRHAVIVEPSRSTEPGGLRSCSSRRGDRAPKMFTGEIAVASKKDSGCLTWAFVIAAGIGLAILFSPKGHDQNPEPTAPAPSPKDHGQNREPAPSSASLPAYKMLFANDKLGGGRFGDALVPSLSRETPLSERERVARGIAQKERLTNLAIYSTEQAYEANTSASFLKEHPDALKQGFLGSLDENTFRPGEATFP